MVTRASLSRRCLFVFVFFQCFMFVFFFSGFVCLFFYPSFVYFVFLSVLFPSEYVICSRLEERLSLWHRIRRGICPGNVLFERRSNIPVPSPDKFYCGDVQKNNEKKRSPRKIQLTLFVAQPSFCISDER